MSLAEEREPIIDHAPITTKGFTLKEDELLFLTHKLDDLLEKIPIGSKLFLTLEKIANNYDDEVYYNGKLEAHSYLNKFKSEWSDEDIYYLYLELERDFKYQVEKWQRSRFSEVICPYFYEHIYVDQ